MAKEKTLKISELVLDDNNFNKGSEFGNQLIEKSFQKFGAGRSIIASEQTNRKARVVELDPKYCDVIVARWINYKLSQSSETGTITVKRNGKELTEKEWRKFLNPKD